MLITKETDEESSLRGRPMSLVQEAYDGTLYFYTSKKDAKVYEVKNDRDICMTFSEPKDNVYVSLTGKATLTTDEELINKYWNSNVAAWFENGKDDPNLAMLKVKINKGEHWDSTNNKFVRLFEMAKAKVFDSSTPNLGENEEFGTK